MNTLPTVWLPAGQNLNQAQRLALAVPARAKPEKEFYEQMLIDRLQAQINANPQEARAMMETSPEHLPEPYLISKNQLKRYWAQTLVQSDSMQPLLRRIDWTQAGSIRTTEPTSLQELLEQIP